MFMFDIETLGSESTSVVLSASIIHFDKPDTTYEELLENALFVKFDVQQQIGVKRVAEKSTIEWWSKQHEYVKKTSLIPSDEDLDAVTGILKLKEYINAHDGPKQTFWARGSLDQMCIDSLCKSFDMDLLTEYNNWRDVRTALDCLCKSTNNGYVDVSHPTFQRHNVIKHHPTHDCAYDIMMMLYGV
jgi:hypothetical protein